MSLPCGMVLACTERLSMCLWPSRRRSDGLTHSEAGYQCATDGRRYAMKTAEILRRFIDAIPLSMHVIDIVKIS